MPRGPTTPAKARAQAINDMTIFVVGLSCSFSAAALLEKLGWQAMNLVLLHWLGLCFFALVVLGLRQRLGATARYGST